MSEDAVRNSYVRFSWNFCAICGQELVHAHDGQSDRPHCTTCVRFYYSNPVPAACCFLTNEAGELLLVQRSVEPRRGLWTLPGGFVEAGESTEEAALRELKEETNLTGRNPRLMGLTSRSHPLTPGIIVIGYLVDDWEGDIVVDTDAMDYGFFSRENRPQIAFEVHQDLIAIYDNLTKTGLPGT